MASLAEEPPRTYKVLQRAGIVLLGLAAVLAYEAATATNGYARASGTVVQVVSGSAGTRPEIAYMVQDQQFTTQGPESGLFVKAHKEGETVAVLYTAAHPETGHLYCPEDEWMWAELVGAAGTALLVSHLFLRKRALAWKR